IAVAILARLDPAIGNRRDGPEGRIDARWPARRARCRVRALGPAQIAADDLREGQESPDAQGTGRVRPLSLRGIQGVPPLLPKSLEQPDGLIGCPLVAADQGKSEERAQNFRVPLSEAASSSGQQFLCARTSLRKLPKVAQRASA